MKLKFKYNETEVLFATEKLLNLTRLLSRTEKYTLGYISARIGSDISMCEDILQYLHAGGFYHVDKDGLWSVLNN